MCAARAALWRWRVDRDGGDDGDALCLCAVLRVDGQK